MFNMEEEVQTDRKLSIRKVRPDFDYGFDLLPILMIVA